MKSRIRIKVQNANTVKSYQIYIKKMCDLHTVSQKIKTAVNAFCARAHAYTTWI